MKGMPLPFESFQGKGVLDFCRSSATSDCLPNLKYLPLSQQQNWQPQIDNLESSCCYAQAGVLEPRSVLEASRRPSPPTSSSTLSSSHPGACSAASTDTAGLAATPSITTADAGHPSSLEAEKCGHLGMEDWESVLSVGGNGGGSYSPSQEQSILRLMMGDMEDPSFPHPDMVEYNNSSCFGMVDQVFNFEPAVNSTNGIDPASLHGNLSASSSSPDYHHLGRIGSILNQLPNPSGFPLPAAFNPGVFDEKPQIVANHSHTQLPQNSVIYLPQMQEEPHLMLSPPPPKRLHSVSVAVAGPEAFLQRHQLQMNIAKQKVMGGDELVNSNNQVLLQIQQTIINPICQAAELIESGNPVHAQGILARLNHQLSQPVGKPPQRAAFYFKEALQLLIHLINTNSLTSNHSVLSGYNLIFKIGAYKSFSEISPVLQFANFTCNQALLEAFDGHDKIHIVDFDLGYGGQWASLMQELALRSNGCPSLKITAFASPSSHDELELSFTQENLKLFARDLNMPFELEILNLDCLSSGSWLSKTHEKEVVAVNLSIVSFCNYPAALPLVLRFVKQLSPKIVVSLDRGCDRNDLPFAHHLNHAMQAYALLLESLDAVNMNPDSLQKIERFWVQPEIEKIVVGRHRCPDRTPSWRSLFLQCGFTPLTFSNFTESQAECLVQRSPVRGFHVEKKHASLALFWQRKELISASAWRC